MPAAGRLLRRHQDREPPSRRRHDQDAGWRVRCRQHVKSAAGGFAMNAEAPILAAGRAPSLKAIGMTKIFGPLVALDDVSIDVPAGSFHALLGENGAGKSTLVKSIMGFYSADKGQVLLDGNEVMIRTPKDARANGIGMVYQHFTLVPSL